MVKIPSKLLRSVSQARCNLDPVETHSGGQSCFDLVRQARPAERPFDQSLFQANAKPYAPSNWAQRGSEAISNLKVPPEAQIRLPLRKCLSAYLYDFLKESSGAAYRIRTCDPIITNDVLYRLS